MTYFMPACSKYVSVSPINLDSLRLLCPHVDGKSPEYSHKMLSTSQKTEARSEASQSHNFLSLSAYSMSKSWPQFGVSVFTQVLAWQE